MQRRVLSIALTFTIAAGTLTLSGCATTEVRISQHPEMYQRLSPTDQALVSQGQIRPGMTMDAVWLAWGTPDQKIPDNMRVRPTETWVYLRYETPPSYGGPYYYGPFDWSYIPPKLCFSGTCRRHRRCNAEFGLPTSWRVWFPHRMKRRFFVEVSMLALATG